MVAIADNRPIEYYKGEQNTKENENHSVQGNAKEKKKEIAG